jgi:hypothetical protein
MVASRNLSRLHASAVHDIDKRRVGDELLYLSCLYFLVIAFMANRNYSRLAYEGWAEPLITIGADCGADYLVGLKLTPNEYHKFAPVSEFMRGLEPGSRPNLFFGPGLEYLYRAYGIKPPRGLPLWYQTDLTWIEGDVAEILRAFEQQRFDYAIFYTHTICLVPEELKDYLDKHFVKLAPPKLPGIADDQITIWKRGHSTLLTPAGAAITLPACQEPRERRPAASATTCSIGATAGPRSSTSPAITRRSSI